MDFAGEQELSRVKSVCLLGFVVLLGLSACDKLGDQIGVLKTTPHEQYQKSLIKSGLDQRALGRQWIGEANASLQRAAPIASPYREVGWFAGDDVRAAAWRMDVKRGQRISIEMRIPPETSGLVFVDLLKPQRNGGWKTVESLPIGQTRIEHSVDETSELLLRVQPELLAAGRYELQVTIGPSLEFPVKGKTAAAVKSRFGAQRDGGARLHHGIDIFAPRGTPVLAVASGIILSTKETQRGGKVVWVQDRQRIRRYYYAHLDEVDVSAGSLVDKGQVLGAVGNTGNARTTPPHLHFGIYMNPIGPVDPLPFVYATPQTAPKITARLDGLGKTMRVSARATLKQSPNVKRDDLVRVERNTVVNVVAATTKWYRVVTPTGVEGFLPAGNLTRTDKPLRVVRLARGQVMRAKPASDAAEVGKVDVATLISIHGRQGKFAYIKLASGEAGWIAVDQT
jgi:peptidoglycan LD-endopeptidase LytH